MGVSNLPGAQGQVFETLDAYLDFLEARGVYGQQWYERLPDGRYQLATRNAGEAPQIFTRAELAQRFGFVE